jgi:hypothetical protein
VVSSSLRASGRMHHCTTCGRGRLRAVAFVRVLIADRAAVSARGGAPAPRSLRCAPPSQSPLIAKEREVDADSGAARCPPPGVRRFASIVEAEPCALGAVPDAPL